MRDFHASPDHAEILTALAAVRRGLPPVMADGRDPDHGRPFATLGAIMPHVDAVLDSHGVDAVPYPCSRRGAAGAAIRFRHRQSQQWVEFRMTFPIQPEATIQEVVAAVTCARRAIYTCVFEVRIQHDGDGEMETGRADEAAEADAAVRKPARRLPTVELIHRAQAVEHELQRILGASGARAMLIAETGSRFFSSMDAGRIEAFIDKAQALLEDPTRRLVQGGGGDGFSETPSAGPIPA